ncbi:MAG: AAA family ATPase [Leptospirales bacterium]
MKINKFTIRRFRSLYEASEIKIENYTVLTGQNNEGKSNILKALSICFSEIGSYQASSINRVRNRRVYRRRYGIDANYDWERDYPIEYQNEEEGNAPSVFILDFKLSDIDQKSIKKLIEQETNSLRIELSFGREKVLYEVTIAEKKYKSEQRSKKTEDKETIKTIFEYISENINFQYIPTIRTEDLVERIIDDMVSEELQELESDPEYRKLIKKIIDYQKPKLKIIGERIKETITYFVPNIKDVQIRTDDTMSDFIRNAGHIVINDGTETDLDFKGDGIKSLVAIALMRHYGDASRKSKNVMLAIEEPEAHLHPNAIHKLRKVIGELSQNDQVIISTHSPLFIERLQIERNIIVSNKKAKHAESIVKIREALGVGLADNLINAKLVLILEGEDDKLAIEHFLTTKSLILKDAISDGILSIDYLSGSSNLKHKANMYKNNLCSVFAFMDYDKAGKNSLADAKKLGVILEGEYMYAKVPGLTESEIEDFYGTAFLRDHLLANHAINYIKLGKGHPSAKEKWSERMKVLARTNGFEWE